METSNLINYLANHPSDSINRIIRRIQEATIADLGLSPYFVVNNVKVYPKEIEVYAYIKDVFPDNSVHRNERQQNNEGHFYIHRFSKGKDAPYSGHAGVDYCFSNIPELFYTWLIRSAYFDGKGLIQGPCNFRKALLELYGGGAHAIEEELFNMDFDGGDNPVMFSERINLTSEDDLKTACLRAVSGDGSFKVATYPMKGVLVENYVKSLMQAGEKSREECIRRGVEIIGYHMSSLQNL